MGERRRLLPNPRFRAADDRSSPFASEDAAAGSRACQRGAMDDLATWLGTRGGIAHRRAALTAGYGAAAQRAAVDSGRALAIRRHWLALDDAPRALVAAARATARITCVTLARDRGWWMPDGLDSRIHLAFDPHGATMGIGAEVHAHWSRALAPAPALGLRASIEDALAHIAECLDPEAALILWEAAVRAESISPDALRRVRWRSAAARRCAESVTGLSDSGLETIFMIRLAHWNLPIRHQAIVAGHPIDFLIGRHLAVQVDGWAYHSSSAQRTKDVALDAELTLRGYTVLRFTYAQVVHDWPAVERAIARAIAAGAAD